MSAGAGNGRWTLGEIADCCIGPMLLLIVLTSVLGIAIGYKAAIAVGVVAGGVGVAALAVRHRIQAR
jgi:hypothetical protein